MPVYFLPRHDLLVVFVVSLMRMIPGFGVVWLSEVELACLPSVSGGGWVFTSVMESLILAQDERWRRA